jgi:protein-tyrosine phosphatase
VAEQPTRVMTVCTGNICRSPMAQVVLRARLDAAGLAEVVVDSRGVSDEEAGNPIDDRARAALLDRGYPAAGDHRARQVTAGELGDYDLVLAMTQRHAAALHRLAARGGQPGRIALYRELDPDVPQVAPGDLHLLDIDDPWYGGPAQFEACLDQLEQGADGVVRLVAALHRR